MPASDSLIPKPHEIVWERRGDEATDRVLENNSRETAQASGLRKDVGSIDHLLHGEMLEVGVEFVGKALAVERFGVRFR
jgi:hypothetical protein